MSVTFYYPSSGSVSSSITLKNPDYGDSEQFDNNIIFHIGMAGTVFSYKKKKKQTLLLNFSGITKAQAEEFEAFYLANAGNELGYVDTLAREWQVRIINNPLESVTNISFGSCELRSFTIQARAISASAIPDKALIDDVANALVDDVGNVLVYV